MNENQILKKKKRHPIRTFFSISFIFIACFLVFSAVQDVMMTLHLKKEITLHQNKVNDLEEQKVHLAKEKKNLEDPEYVKRFVRGKYLVSKPGEQVFILPSKDGNEE